MLQQIAVYIILTIDVAYIIYYIYTVIKKKEACNKCELMKEVKRAK